MSFGKWRFARASVAGVSHINQNTGCQDRLACQTVKTENAGEVFIAVIADGAGSTSEGERGAAIACDFFVGRIADFLQSGHASMRSLNREFGQLWIEHFQEHIAEIAKKETNEMREYASTLVGAVVGNDETIFYQVGDGGAVFSIDGTVNSYIFGVEPHEGEYVNMTDFLTDEEAPDRLRFARIEESIEDLILFSDGIFAVAVDYQKNKPHEPFLRPMIAPLRNGGAEGLDAKLANFLGSEKINEKTDDDKTIILASRASAV